MKKGLFRKVIVLGIIFLFVGVGIETIIGISNIDKLSGVMKIKYNIDTEVTQTITEDTEKFMITYGGKDYDNGYSGQQTNDGGYIITGYTESFGVGNNDFWLIKTDKDGRSRNKVISSSLLLWFLERFPMLEKLLNLIKSSLR